MNKQRTPIKPFAVYTIFLNLLLGAALIYISVKISGSHKAPEYVYAAISSVIALIPCWAINFVLFRKEKLNEIVLALTYSAGEKAFYLASPWAFAPLSRRPQCQPEPLTLYSSGHGLASFQEPYLAF